MEYHSLQKQFTEPRIMYDREKFMILNAVLCVWNEEDIIESTVKHLFAQGCSNVFIIDNDSNDHTVRNAINAGGKLAATFKTKDFDEDQKVAYLNAVVRKYNEQSNEKQIWWLYADADEFPNIEGPGSILHYLNKLDPSIRAVHGYLFDHMPTHQPYHVQGYHPADFQPFCIKTSAGKIPLLRYDKGEKHLFSIGGAHDFVSNGCVIPIIKDFLHIHHFQYRNPDFTLLRSKILATKRNEWMKKFAKQLGLADTSGYEQRYAKLRKIYKKNKYVAIKTKSLVYNFRNIVRWYDIHEEKHFSSSAYDKSICLAVYYFFLKEYELAVCRFKDALDVCTDEEMNVWIVVKIAECFASSDIDAARSILSGFEHRDNAEIRAYLDKDFSYIVNTEKHAGMKDIIGKVELYRSVFPDGIEQRQKELGDAIEKNILSWYPDEFSG